MPSINYLIAALCLQATFNLQAQNLSLPIDTTSLSSEQKPTFSANKNIAFEAVVKSIDRDKRLATLVFKDGSTKTLKAIDTNYNLDNINPGDFVSGHYALLLDVELIAEEDLPLYTGETTANTVTDVQRSTNPEHPVLKKISRQTQLRQVVAINLQTRQFKLKDVDGKVQEYQAKTAEHLSKAQINDWVLITKTEAVAVSVEKID